MQCVVVGIAARRLALNMMMAALLLSWLLPTTSFGSTKNSNPATQKAQTYEATYDGIVEPFGTVFSINVGDSGDCTKSVESSKMSGYNSLPHVGE